MLCVQTLIQYFAKNHSLSNETPLNTVYLCSVCIWISILIFHFARKKLQLKLLHFFSLVCVRAFMHKFSSCFINDIIQLAQINLIRKSFWALIFTKFACYQLHTNQHQQPGLGWGNFFVLNSQKLVGQTQEFIKWSNFQNPSRKPTLFN